MMATATTQPFGAWAWRIAIALTFIAPPSARAWQLTFPVAPPKLALAMDKRRLSDDLKVEVKLRVDKVEFKQLESIPLEVFVRNVSSTTAQWNAEGMNPLSEYRNVLIRAYDYRGDLMSMTRYQSFDARYGSFQVGGGLGATRGARPIPVGREIRMYPVANLATDMTSPGEYTILAEFPTGEIREVDGVKVPVMAQSEPLKVRVLSEPTRWPFP